MGVLDDSEEVMRAELYLSLLGWAVTIVAIGIFLWAVFSALSDLHTIAKAAA